MPLISIQRPVTVVDVYGDPQPGSWQHFADFDGLIGWTDVPETLEPGRNTVVRKRTAYIRGTEPSGILATDRAVIDGVTYLIDGDVAEWADDDGHVGTELHLKAVS